MNERLIGASRIYLDANCIIYFIERTDELQGKVAKVIQFAGENDRHLVCSEVGVAECLYGAFKAKSRELEAAYKEIFYDLGLFELCAVDGDRVKAAAKIGAEKGLKLVDALHFVAAMEMECEIFVTNDERFRSSHGVEVVQLKDL